jgi:hypothetical protein
LLQAAKAAVQNIIHYSNETLARLEKRTTKKAQQTSSVFGTTIHVQRYTAA